MRSPARMPPLTADCETVFSCRLIHLQASQYAHERLPCMTNARQTSTYGLPHNPCGEHNVGSAGALTKQDLTPAPASDKGAGPLSWNREVHHTLGRRLLPAPP